MARIVFFASDRAEIAQIRRIRHYRQAGHSVASFSMVKRDGQLRQAPDWQDVDLGEIENENLPKRLARALLSLGTVWRNRALLRQADVISARNIDMVVLAWLARQLSGSKAPIIYECLDIHGIFTGTGRKSAIARWVERKMLDRCTLLLVSSPGFIRGYFERIQGYRGKWALIENKLVFEDQPLPRPAAAPAPRQPLVLGWVGTIRCAPSLRLLAATAAALPDDVKILIRGMVHRHAVPDFDAVVSRHGNIEYGGPYSYPEGLAEVYGSCDLVWSQDLWQQNANSSWLLPNRIYEASWFGCPSIAVATTETGRAVADGGLGFTVPSADPEALISLLKSLGRDRIAAASQALLARPGTDFQLTTDDINRAVAAALGQDGRQGGTASRIQGQMT